MLTNGCTRILYILLAFIVGSRPERRAVRREELRIQLLEGRHTTMRGPAALVGR